MSNEEQANVPQHHREGGAVVFDPPENEKEAARRRREDEQHEFARSQVKTNTKLALFTGALVLATLCTIGVGIWQATIYHAQLTAMQGQLDEMRRSGEQSTQQMWSAIGNINWEARSMDLSEKQSEKSLGATIEQNKLDQRAWIGLKDIIDVQFSDAPGPITVSFSITNYGKTPARSVLVAGFLHSADTPIDPVEYMKHPVEKGGEKSWNVIFPNQVLYLRPHTGRTDELGVENSKNGRRPLYLFVVITYEDIFSQDRLTRMCARYDPDSKSFRPCLGDYDYAD